MNFKLDPAKMQWPPPGSFQAGILKSIEVPFQKIDISGGQYPPPPPPDPADLPPLTLDWTRLGSFRISFTEEEN